MTMGDRQKIAGDHAIRALMASGDDRSSSTAEGARAAACAVRSAEQLAAAAPPSARLIAEYKTCSDRAIHALMRGKPRRLPEGQHVALGGSVAVEFRELSPLLGSKPLLIRPSRAHWPARAMDPTRSGLGIPLVAYAPRCEDRPACHHLPPEGVFRPVTAWVEAHRGQPLIVIANPAVIQTAHFGAHSERLNSDFASHYDVALRTTALDRLAIWGLLGGPELSRRSGVFLMEDYDPTKAPLVMIHGLGGSPTSWADLNREVWSDPTLRARYQVWHVVYQTNAPWLIVRRRVERYLDAAWATIDPEGDDPARRRIVLVGHSMGGLVARLLASASGDRVWDASFGVAPDAIRASDDDRDELERTFRFQPYPGLTRVILLSAPHGGSPNAKRPIGRLAQWLIGSKAPEVLQLRAIARANEPALQPSVRTAFLSGRLNSVASLATDNALLRAVNGLVPACNVPYHTVTGQLRRNPGSDGVVPVESALLDGAASSEVVAFGHKTYQSQAAVAEVVRVLRLADRAPIPTPAGDPCLPRVSP
jgi:pimeloyl-ACP methyl ester carboxylesterase